MAAPGRKYRTTITMTTVVEEEDGGETPFFTGTLEYRGLSGPVAGLLEQGMINFQQGLRDEAMKFEGGATAPASVAKKS